MRWEDGQAVFTSTLDNPSDWSSAALLICSMEKYSKGQSEASGVIHNNHKWGLTTSVCLYSRYSLEIYA